MISIIAGTVTLTASRPSIANPTPLTEKEPSALGKGVPSELRETRQSEGRARIASDPNRATLIPPG